MHAVVVSVTIHDGEEATKDLRGEIVPRVKQAPGFVAGYWVRVENGDKGRGTIVFESEDAARAVAEQIQQTRVARSHSTTWPWERSSRAPEACVAAAHFPRHRVRTSRHTPHE